MTEYIPTTERVKDSYVWFRDEVTAYAARAEFDRWLAQVKAEAWEEGFEASDKRCEEHGELDEFGKPHTCIPNPYRQGEEQ